MTTFDRTGHYRTNQHGTTFWVSGHTVSRDDWPSGLPRPVMRAYLCDDAVLSSRNVTIPNARCPVCYEPVFFFMAANGGRVFFDDLGPPWPKHGCTISPTVDVPGFADADSIARWLQGRRDALGPSAPDDALSVRPDCMRGTARIVRRRGTTIAVVETDEGTLAFQIEGAWEGRASKTVFFRKVEPPDAPEALEYLSPELTVVAMRVVAVVELPTKPSIDDFPAIAELGIPEVEVWFPAYLRGFARGPRLKIGGHVVGVAGRLGRSRVVLLPLAAWFDKDEDDWVGDDAECVDNGLRQVREWTGRIARMLDKSSKTPKDPLYRDVFVWLVPERSWAFNMELTVRNLSYLGRPRSGTSLGPPPVHVVQALESEIEEGLCETRFGLEELTPGERAYLSEGAKRHTEKRWLAAMLTEAGLDPIFARLEGEGVRFQFMGTRIGLQLRWGQQAILPDGRRLLVLLHLSSLELGLAFVHFGAPVEDEYGFETHQADAIFHAKRLATVLKFLGAGPE
ncbi:hypothetical protein [Methylobacterium sp. SyP6R]|uniref:hypothetical protein n=1 Tax=Methylobacterium sp. SyP6R TaxID=2718876 RepID=UPI001F2B642C|nr:hypothetical protein [Methylobacterium sp. SyP6R]MCF4127899.1 hypothetical protein [Methylobacterium sp. SyP6R]